MSLLALVGHIGQLTRFRWDQLWTPSEPFGAGSVDTRLPADASNRHLPAGVLQLGSTAQTAPTGDANREQESLEQDAVVAAWSAVILKLNPPDVTRLLWGIQGGQRRLPQESTEQTEWAALMSKLESEWRAYLEHLRFDDPDPGVLDVESLEATWTERQLPLLKNLGNTSEESLIAVRDVILKAGWRVVRDDRVLEARDTLAWFASCQEVAGESPPGPTVAEEVGFRQLFQQPAAYRGHSVRIRGTVRRISQVRAPNNPLGIEHYQILWTQPVGSANAPFVVYALQLPQGFPVETNASSDSTPVERHDDVEFTGIFFKRFAYRAQDGIRTAPLLVARISEWEPEQTPVPQHTDLPSPLTIGITLALVAAFCISWAAFVYRSSQNIGRLKRE